MGIVASLIVLLLAVQVSDESQYSQIAQRLRASLERNLLDFSPQTRRHFATRMYRITGDLNFIPLIKQGARETADLLKRDAAEYSDSAYRAERTIELLARFNVKTRKGRLRHDFFEQRPQLLLITEILAECKQTREYGLANLEEFRSADSAAMAILRNFDFRNELLDSAIIRIYSAQVANRVYDLYFLGITDLRAELLTAFQHCFPDTADDALTHAEFEDKLYGLTHIVIAASEYYQAFVSDPQSQAAVDYLSENLEAILAEARNDIVAEVGLCFLLAKSDRDEEVERCRKLLIDAIDKESQMVPSVDGDTDAEEGEHRNVLALMLMAWSGQLHPGPAIAIPTAGSY